MDLPVTVRVEQQEVVYQVRAAVGAPLDVVDMPPPLQRQALAAGRANPFLLEPQVARPPTPLQGLLHLERLPLLEVQLPGRVVGVGAVADQSMPADAHAGRPEQGDVLRPPSRPRRLTAEGPRPRRCRSEVGRCDPSVGSVAVAPTRPAPQAPGDGAIPVAERAA